MCWPCTNAQSTPQNKLCLSRGRQQWIWLKHVKQSGRSPKVVALFSATNFSKYILELLQLHDTIKIEWNYALIHYKIVIRSHLMIQKYVWNFIFATKFSRIFLLHG